jgi:hypothetical protein
LAVLASSRAGSLPPKNSPPKKRGACEGAAFFMPAVR